MPYATRHAPSAVTRSSRSALAPPRLRRGQAPLPSRPRLISAGLSSVSEIAGAAVRAPRLRSGRPPDEVPIAEVDPGTRCPMRHLVHVDLEREPVDGTRFIRTRRDVIVDVARQMQRMAATPRLVRTAVGDRRPLIEPASARLRVGIHPPSGVGMVPPYGRGIPSLRRPR